jgi:hypothetical protein
MNIPVDDPTPMGICKPVADLQDVFYRKKLGDFSKSQEKAAQRLTFNVFGYDKDGFVSFLKVVDLKDAIMVK